MFTITSTVTVAPRYLAGRACYEVKDADDPLKQVEVPADSVIRLREGGHGFAKGDNVSRYTRAIYDT